MTQLINAIVGNPILVVFLAAAIFSGAEARFGGVQRLWWLAVAGGVAVLIETAMYLTGTPPGADFIQGTQGRYFLPILRETPAEAQIASHRLMLRAGMIKQASAGIYSWLPLGYKVLSRIEEIVHEEQQRAAEDGAGEEKFLAASFAPHC